MLVQYCFDQFICFSLHDIGFVKAAINASTLHDNWASKESSYKIGILSRLCTRSACSFGMLSLLLRLLQVCVV